MAANQDQTITLDLPLQRQTVNVDVESIAPLQGFTAEAFDVANSTITALVANNTGADKQYRLVIHADVEAGTSATARIVSADKATFKKPVKFERITNAHASIIEPVLAKLGTTLDPSLSKEKQLRVLAQQFKTADITVPAGSHVLRIHMSQVVKPVADNPKKFTLDLYAPLLCFAPQPGVLLSATLVFPVDFTSQATITSVSYRSLPGMADPQLAAGGNDQVQLARHPAYGWVFQQVDPVITAEWQYN